MENEILTPNKPEISTSINRRNTMENEILTPNEASKQHMELFEESQAKFRNLHKGMETALEEIKVKNAAADERNIEANNYRESAKSLEKAAEAQKAEAEQLLEAAKTKMQEAKDKEVRIAGLRAEQEKTDNALTKQREEIMAREQAVIASEKSSAMKERELRYERMKIERLIKDAQISKELKEEMLTELPKGE